MHLTRTHVAAADNVAFFFTMVSVLVAPVRSADVRFSNMSLQFEEALDRGLCPTFQRSVECPGLFLHGHVCVFGMACAKHLA